MTDLERFFHQLVQTLAETDSARLRQSLSIADIRNSILPYRAHRRALGLESSEDYELLLMRLCAGEGGFARTSPDEAHSAFAAELSGANPDLSLVELHADASIILDQAAVARFVEHNPELAYAPREPETTQPRPPQKAREPAGRRSDKPADQIPASHGGCVRCGSVLPQNRVVNFCPQCGYNLRQRRCASCGLELEPTWRHCIDCGATLPQG